MTNKEALESFLSRVAEAEGGRSQSKYADIKQAAKIINGYLGGALYPMIKAIEEARQEQPE